MFATLAKNVHIRRITQAQRLLVFSQAMVIVMLFPMPFPVIELKEMLFNDEIDSKIDYLISP